MVVLLDRSISLLFKLPDDVYNSLPDDVYNNLICTYMIVFILFHLTCSYNNKWITILHAPQWVILSPLITRYMYLLWCSTHYIVLKIFSTELFPLSLKGGACPDYNNFYVVQILSFISGNIFLNSFGFEFSSFLIRYA